MSNLIPFDDNMKLPAALANLGSDDDWGSGQLSGFPVISLQGKRFTIQRGDTSETIMSPHDPDTPAGSVELVILRTHKGVARTYYAKAWQPDSVDKPACYSNDGVAPAADAESPQSLKCATCPHSQWGSRITDNGKKAKACSEVKRLAVASPTLLNDPMLLRLPPTSLKPWDQYLDMLHKRGGFRPAQVVTKIGFDREVVHQQLTFKPVALVSEEMARQIAEERESMTVRNIIGMGAESGPPVAALAVVADEPKPTPKPAPKAEPEDVPEPTPAPKAKATTPKAKAKPAAPAPVEVPELDVDLDSLGAELDDILGDMDFDD